MPLIATPNLIFVAVESRPGFDRIALPLTKYERVLVKKMQGDGVEVIFQYWLDDRTAVQCDVAEAVA